MTWTSNHVKALITLNASPDVVGEALRVQLPAHLATRPEAELRDYAALIAQWGERALSYEQIVTVLNLIPTVPLGLVLPHPPAWISDLLIMRATQQYVTLQTFLNRWSVSGGKATLYDTDDVTVLQEWELDIDTL